MKKVGSKEKRDSKRIYWHTKPCRASRDLVYTADLLGYIGMLCTWFIAPSSIAV